MIQDQPWFDEHLKGGFADFFAVVRANINAVYSVAARELAAHPALSRVFKGLSDEQTTTKTANAREMLLRAADGEWTSYEQHLERQGAFYASLDIQFVDWFDVVRIFQRAYTPLLLERHSHDSQRLSAALNAMFIFYDRTLAVLARAYLAAKEREIRKTEEVLTATISSLHDAVYLANEKGDFVLRNPAAVRLSGETGIRNIYDPNIGASVRTENGLSRIKAQSFPIHRAMRGETVVDERVVRLLDNGERQHLSINAAPILSRDGTKLGAVTTVRDVTLQHEVDEQRARAAESEARSRNFAEASRLKSEFLANMSHELRTPLNSIIGFAELLHDGEVGPLATQQIEFVGDILKSGRHLLQLINDILDLSKVEAGRMEFVAEKLRISEAIGEVCALQRTLSFERSITVVIDADPSVDEAFLDAGRLKQVLYNFVSNALKFTPEGGKVTIRTRAEGDRDVRIEVEDNGIGIAASDIHRLFVEFQQLRAGATKSHSGTGLGLALSRKLAESQGGSIGVASELGIGSTFYVTLPRRYEAPPTKPSTGVSIARRRVLIVEDSSSHAQRIERTLVENGYDVRAIGNGEEAVEVVSAGSFDAVLIDIVLPDIHGLEVVRRIRAVAAKAKTPVVLLTVVNEELSCALAVDDVVAKPCDDDALLRALNRVGLDDRAGTVFVVDDDESSQRLVSVAVEKAGHRARVFSDARSALAALSVGAPSAIVLDLQMPSMDGFAFLHALRAQPSYATLPVVVWTVLDLTQKQLDTLSSMAHSIIQKDGSTVEVVNALQTCLRAAPSLETA